MKYVTVKVIGVLRPSVVGERLVESIDVSLSTKSGKVLATPKMPSGEILVNADSKRQKT